MNNIDVADLKQKAVGRWSEILASVGGLQPEFIHFDKREGPCPKCGGATRYRGLDESTGALFCSHCFNHGNGDGIAALMWLTGETFSEAVEMVAKHLGSATEQGHALDWDSVIGAGSKTAATPAGYILETVARMKGVTAVGFQAYGASVQGQAVVFPMYGPDGQPCSSFTLTADGGKGLYEKDKSVGLFLPKRPEAGETWAIVEGVKDATALHSLGYLAAGLPTSALNPKFAPLFRDVDVVIIPDADQPGQNGAAKTAANLAGVARSVRIACLPVEILASKGADVRDVLRDQGEDAIRKAIAEASSERTPIAEPEPAVLADAAKRIRLPDIQDASDFCAEDIPQPPELIQGVLHRGSKLLLGGGSKGGKTWTLMDMALSVAYGIPWLGCETAQSKVLYVNLEIQKSFAQRRLKTLADAKGIVQEAGRLEVWNLRGHATSHMEIFPRILDRIADDDNGLILLDPIYKLYGGMDNENGAREMAALMNSIEHLAVETGAAVAFAAHYSKGNQANKEAIDRVSGSGVFARDPDSLLNFTRHQTEDCYTVEATLRNFPPMTPFAVRWQFPLFVRDASLDPAELKTPGKSRADKIVDAERREAEQYARLLKAIRLAPDGDTAKGLRGPSGLNCEDFSKAILKALQDGKAEKCRVEKHTRTEDGYKPTKLT